jgi:purine-binding chemotaxis protein CheW
MIYPARSLKLVEADAEVLGFVSFRLGTQWLGVPVVRVQEVLASQTIFPVPLAPAEVAGFLNLRGQIVTVIDVRHRLGLPARGDGEAGMNIVVRVEDELFSLLVDEVGDVVEARTTELESLPPTLVAQWRTFCEAVIRLPSGLLVVMSIDRALGLAAQEAP